jgi:hypothetical protein
MGGVLWNSVGFQTSEIEQRKVVKKTKITETDYIKSNSVIVNHKS